MNQTIIPDVIPLARKAARVTDRMARLDSLPMSATRNALTAMAQMVRRGLYAGASRDWPYWRILAAAIGSSANVQPRPGWASEASSHRLHRLTVNAAPAAGCIGYVALGRDGDRVVDRPLLGVKLFYNNGVCFAAGQHLELVVGEKADTRLLEVQGLIPSMVPDDWYYWAGDDEAQNEDVSILVRALVEKGVNALT